MASVFVLLLPGAVCLRIEVRHYECLGWVSQPFHCLKSHFRVFFLISALKHCRLRNVETVLKDQVKKQCLSLSASLSSASNHVYTEIL